MAKVSVCLCVFLTLLIGMFISSADSDSCTDCGNEIPLEVALRLSEITDEEELFKEFHIKSVKPNLYHGLFLFSLPRQAGTKPKPAGCVPEVRSVSLRESTDPRIVYWPECTRLEQCGGCCGHKLMHCQPIETQIVNLTVNVMKYDWKKKFKEHKRVTVSREKHTKCKCDCIKKEQDCTKLQEYKENECRCVCTNKEEEDRCSSEHNKHWNSTNCSCECHSIVECSSGTYNQKTCRCDRHPLQDPLTSTNVGNFTMTRTLSSPSRQRGPDYSSLEGNRLNL